MFFVYFRAQILYRLEQYQDCYNLYRDVVKNTTDEYEDERKANMAAVVANLAALNPVRITYTYLLLGNICYMKVVLTTIC